MSQDGTHVNILYIMFTRDDDLDSRRSVAFQPNHFCPLIFNDDDDFLLNKGEFPPLCSELPPQKKDFPTTLKQARKKFRRIKNHRQHRKNVGNGKKPKAALSCFTCSDELLSKSNAKDPMKVIPENACYESNSANETQLSMKCVSRSWLNRKGQ
jgi:hypothetical protein